MLRVVSLVPSITETLLAWGVTPVAVTRFCPATGSPKVGGTKNPDLGAIVELAPDLVLMDREENRAQDAVALEGAGLRVHATHVRSVGEVSGTLGRLRAIIGLEPLTFPVPSPAPGTRLAVFVPIWKRPWMTISGATYGSSLLDVTGFDNVYARSDTPYPTVDLDHAASLGPALVLAPSEPYPFATRHRADLERVAPVVLVDGQDLFWWGDRTSVAAERFLRLAKDISGA